MYTDRNLPFDTRYSTRLQLLRICHDDLWFTMVFLDFARHTDVLIVVFLFWRSHLRPAVCWNERRERVVRVALVEVEECHMASTLYVARVCDVSAHRTRFTHVILGLSGRNCVLGE